MNSGGAVPVLVRHDTGIANWIRQPALQQHSTLRYTRVGARIYGNPGVVAFASFITASVQRRSPRDAGWLGPLLYGVATLTGVSRMYNHQHWASDVLLAAGIGTVGGLVVGRWHERHP